MDMTLEDIKAKIESDHPGSKAGLWGMSYPSNSAKTRDDCLAKLREDLGREPYGITIDQLQIFDAEPDPDCPLQQRVLWTVYPAFEQAL
jgi:hypothetical protein